MTSNTHALIDVDGLTVEFETRDGKVAAVRGPRPQAGSPGCGSAVIVLARC